MIYKITDIFFLWTIIEILIVCCNGRPHVLNDFITNKNHSEEAMQRLLRVFGLNGKVPQQKSLSLPPQYMVDLYKSYSDNPASEHKLRYRRANTVRSLFDKGKFTCYFLFEIIILNPFRRIYNFFFLLFII